MGRKNGISKISIIIIIVIFCIILTSLLSQKNNGLSKGEIENIIQNSRSVRELENVYFELTEIRSDSVRILSYIWQMDNKTKTKIPDKSITGNTIFDFDERSIVYYDEVTKIGFIQYDLLPEYNAKKINDDYVRDRQWKYIKNEMIGEYDCFKFENRYENVENQIWIDKKTNLIIKTASDNIKTQTFSNIIIDSVKHVDVEIPTDVKIEIKL